MTTSPQRVAFFEFPVFQGVMPLVSGYLQASACRNADVKQKFQFQAYSIPVSAPNIIEQVENVDADLYAFSCYVWNMGLVKRILPVVLSRRPRATILLGGPQVMNQADRYLSPDHPQVLVCNSEGEEVFRNLLTATASGEADLRSINGLSFYQDGQLITTPKQERIPDLDSIPSPYFGNCLTANGHAWAVVETNRGCPFTCTYCYWGASINAKVRTFSLDRIKNELTWLSENKVLYVFFADANFGMLKRDVEIARHLVQCKKKNGFPLTVYFSSSKNTPDRVWEITRTFDEAGLIATQPISLQSVSMDVLKNVKRDNIKTSSYIQLQKALNDKKLSSFLEIIWPLPGETLTSFKQGMGRLCALGADSFTVYPLLIINNVEMATQREQYQIKTIADPDQNSEAEIVIGTKDVSYRDYIDGVIFSYHLMSLHSLRGLRFVANRLDQSGKMSFDELISAFSRFCDQQEASHYNTYIQNTVGSSEHYKFASAGGVLHVILHTDRGEFDRLLYNFLSSLPFWQDPEIRFLFDLDLLNRPYVYRDTPIRVPSCLSIVERVKSENSALLFDIPEGMGEVAREALGVAATETQRRLRVNYRRDQFPFGDGKFLQSPFTYCQDKLHKMASILPQWSTV